MEPVTAIATAISSIRTATEIAQLLKSSSESFVEAEHKLGLADLMNNLADAKMAISELKDALQGKDEEIKDLRLELKEATSPTLIFEKGAYYTESGDGPYCTACHDTKNQRVRLTKMPHGFQDFGKHQCPSCRAIYNG